MTEERHDVAGGSAEDFIARYGYDLASNRVQLEKDYGNADPATFSVDERTTYAHDSNDRLVSETKDDLTATDTDTFTQYTHNGTLQTHKTVYDGQSAQPGQEIETHVFDYDARGQISQTTVTKDGVETVSSYKYDDTGVRVEQTIAVDGGTPVTTVYHIDPQNFTGYAKPIEELVAGDVVRSYAIGPMLISQADASGTPQFYLHDGHGSTRALLDLSAAEIEKYAYDAFGETLNGTGLTLAKDAVTTWLFAGDGQYDPANGLVNHIARWRQGHRFIGLDPFAGVLTDPISLHKYLYVHGDPMNGIDPSGLFSIAEFSASTGIQGHLRGINTSNKVRTTAHTFHKVLKLIDRAEDIYSNARDLYDLISFDPSDLLDLANSLTPVASLVSNLPVRPFGMSIDLPLKLRNKLKKLGGRLFDLVGRNRAQEIVAEAATALVIQAIGFRQASANWNWSTSQGPDQVARHTTGVWGVFEAKGGTSRLGTGSMAQMRGPWLRKWMNEIINYNRGQQVDHLENAFRGGVPMLAGVIRLDLLSKDPKLRLTIQKYDPPDGRQMRPWGDA